jgi:murein DD-endopeptidase MepM/ murein hydrolase activator NlpD
MHSRFFLALLLLLSACNSGNVSVPVMVLPTPIQPPTFTFSPLPPTSTHTPSPTDTAILTGTPTATPTITEAPSSTSPGAPTITPNLYPHVFPVQPPELAGFSEGGHAFPATDIFAPLGTKFVAVTNGFVDEVSTVDLWNPTTNDGATAGGLSIRIIGDDGVRYYGAHLSAIARGIRPGVWVPAGQLLGLIGNTGDARNSMPHVHFEITSPVPPFTKLDPFPFLTDWLHDKNITPVLSTP